MSPTVSRYRKLDEIPEWDEVAAAGGFYGSTTWLRFHEDPAGWGGGMPDGLDATYLAVREGARTLAVAPCYRAAASGVLPSLTDPWRQYPAGAAYPLVHCGTPRGYTSRLLVRPGLDRQARTAAIAAIVAEVRRLGAESGARSIAFGHLPMPEAREVLAADPSLLPLFTHSDCDLEVPAAFDDYLKRMRHKQRDNAKLAIRHFTEAGFRLERRPFAEIVDAMVPLIGGHERKYGGSVDDAFVKSYLSGCAGRFDERTFCMLRDERLFGVFVSFHHAGVYYARMMGLDDDAIPRRAAGYTNLLFFEIREAAREKIGRIHYGRESLEAKVRYGCTVTPLWTVAAPVDPPGAEARRAMAAEARRLLRDDVSVLEAHHLPQLPPETIARLYGEAEELVKRVDPA